MKIDRNIITKGLVSLRFANQYETCSTFMRLQEYYESQMKEIRGKFFTLEKFMDLYAKQNGNFTYTIDWGGFNVPGHVVRKFFQVFKDSDLLEKEKLLKQELSECLDSKSRFYVIGHYEKDNELDFLQPDTIYRSLAHEVAHGLFYLNSSYKQDALELVRALPEKMTGKITVGLTEMGYAKSVIDDETNAYLARQEQILYQGRMLP
jgi:hypothetical protein